MKRDSGSIHRLFSLIMLLWMGIGVGVLLSITKAGYVNQYLEDCLMQANLAAILIDPYHYGVTEELVFADTGQIKEVFEKSLETSLGNDETLQKLGIQKPITILEFRVYEVTKEGILEVVYIKDEDASTYHYPIDTPVDAPDGTRIVSSAIYAKISVPVKAGFGIQITSIKEHCVDVIVSEEDVYEKI